MPGTSLVGYSPYLRLGELVLTLRLSLGIAVFSKSTAHGHFPETLASDLFIIVNNGPDVPYNAQFLHLRLSCHHEPARKRLLRNCKTKERPPISQLRLKSRVDPVFLEFNLARSADG